MMRQENTHPEDVKAAIRKRGRSLTNLSEKNGLSESACRKACEVRSPRANKVIAEFLDQTRNELWPEWFDVNDECLPSPKKASRQRTKQSSQKNEEN